MKEETLALESQLMSNVRPMAEPPTTAPGEPPVYSIVQVAQQDSLEVALMGSYFARVLEHARDALRMWFFLASVAMAERASAKTAEADRQAAERAAAEKRAAERRAAERAAA